jgi:hypothetical protein
MKLVISAHTSLLSNLIKIFFACKKNISYLEPREGIRAVAGVIIYHFVRFKTLSNIKRQAVLLVFFVLVL